jgi:cytochrome c peroxidase
VSLYLCAKVLESILGDRLLLNFCNFQVVCVSAALLVYGSGIYAASRIETGRQLFYDKTLSIDGSRSCASCHQQSAGFSDPDIFSLGVSGRTGVNSMGLINNAMGINQQFWNGRSPTLAHQVIVPIQNPVEMGLNLATLEQRTGMSTIEISRSLSAFVKSIIVPAGRTSTASQERGRQVFFNRQNQGGGGCSRCHTNGRRDRFFVAGQMNKNGLFALATKVPSLVGVGLTAPYMHDGRFATLEQVVNHYNNFSTRGRGLPSNINLNTQQKADLVNFLKGLGSLHDIMLEKYSDPNKIAAKAGEPAS